MQPTGLRARILSREILSGTFIKTPAYEIMEIMKLSGLDFICIDCEHAGVDRRGMDASLAMARALDLPALVRVPEFTPANVLMALDSGAVGVVIPHVTSGEKAAAVARSAHFGHGGRGFAGSTRWAGQGSRTMHQVLDMDDETIVLAQIEEPEGLEALDDIAGTPGIDGLFVGPADMAVSLGLNDVGHPDLMAVMRQVGEAAARHGKAAVTFQANTANVPVLKEAGISMFFIGSEHTFMLSSAKQVAADIAAEK
ncbi:MAG: aldolase/citrate lyase family protein [Pseudomonadota bacterium]